MKSCSAIECWCIITYHCGMDAVVDAALYERRAPWPEVWNCINRVPSGKLYRVGRSWQHCLSPSIKLPNLTITISKF